MAGYREIQKANQIRLAFYFTHILTKPPFYQEGSKVKFPSIDHYL
jgi:hypothetical protein